MSVFTDAVAVLHTDPHLAVAALYTAPPAPAIPVRVILSRHDPVADFPGMQTQVRAPSWEAELQQAEVPTRPRVRVDLITVLDPLYNITNAFITDVAEDVERCAWACDLGG